MFLRYQAKYYNEETDKEEFGFFWAAEYVKNFAPLSLEDRKPLEDNIKWFDHHLPIPDYYQTEKNRQASKSATSWFKDTAHHFISRMNEMSKILEQYGVEVNRISSKKPLGKKIYEDEYQITVNPHREVAKKVK